MRVGVVDAVDLRALQQRIGADLERSLGGARVGREVRNAQSGREDHHASLLQVSTGPKGHEGLGDLSHGDRRLHASGHVDLLEGVLKSEGVHHRRQHPHIVGPVPIDVRRLATPKDVSSADRHGGLHAEVHDLRQLTRDQ